MRAYAGDSLRSGGRSREEATRKRARRRRAAGGLPAAPAALPAETPGAEAPLEAADGAAEPGQAGTTETGSGASADLASAAPASAQTESGRPRLAPTAPHVLIVGGGATGAALAHDLVLRGVRVTLVEKGELTSGTTGRHQGLLHSGARYAATDRAAAIECVAENKLLRRIAPGSFEENDGLFVAVTDEDADYASEFVDACWQSAVPTRRLTREEALRSEPGLNQGLRLAVQVADATMDAMRLPLRFFATARSNGADIRHFTEVVAVTGAAGAVTGVRVRDRASDREYEIGADLVVNAAGAWAGRVAALAGAWVPITLSRGAMVAVRGRHTNMTVSRLHPPGDGEPRTDGDGDVVVPQRLATILGIANAPIDHPDRATVSAEDVDAIRSSTSALVPSIARAEMRAKWAAVRATPVNGSASQGIRDVMFVDHSRDSRRVDGLVTLVGGRASTMRATAQMAGDLICGRLDVERPCETADTVLLPHTAWYAR